MQKYRYMQILRIIYMLQNPALPIPSFTPSISIVQVGKLRQHEAAIMYLFIWVCALF